jgi:hypothetical protein
MTQKAGPESNQNQLLSNPGVNTPSVAGLRRDGLDAIAPYRIVVNAGPGAFNRGRQTLARAAKRCRCTIKLILRRDSDIK